MRHSASGTHAHTQSTASTPATLTTAEFAALNHVKPNTVRQRLCATASFYGVRPLKLANSRLLWPALIATADDPITADLEVGRHA